MLAARMKIIFRNNNDDDNKKWFLPYSEAKKMTVVLKRGCGGVDDVGVVLQCCRQADSCSGVLHECLHCSYSALRTTV